MASKPVTNNAEFQTWMGRVALVQHKAPPPSADAIWWKAKLRRSTIAEVRATRPMRVSEEAGCVLCGATATWLTTRSAPAVLAFLVIFSLMIAVQLRTKTIREDLN
jgi:hypothetical protein